MSRRKSLFTIVPIALGVLSVVSLTTSYSVYKKTLTTSFIARTSASDNTSNLEVNSLSDQDRLSARQTIEGLALLHGVPVKVSVNSDNTIVITGGRPDKKDGKDSKAEVLENFPGVLGYLRSLSAIPYQADYKSVCIGTTCSQGFEATIQLIGRL